MQRVSSLQAENLRELVRVGGLCFRVGPYTYRVRSKLPQVYDGLKRLYADFPVATPDDFIDFDVALHSAWPGSSGKRRVDFHFDCQRQFSSQGMSQTYATMEWGMNWCVSMHVNEHLKLHAATVAKENQAIVMPGVPGAGKSTLCAAMGLRGWRILSDEHALIPLGTRQVIPLCRPVSLKNESIGVIRQFDPGSIIGPISQDTHKGTVAHMKADLTPDSHDNRPLEARIMLFPKYSTDEPQSLRPRRSTTSFILAAYHSFNYSLLREAGFETMRTLIDGLQCFDLVYHDLDWAVQTVENLHGQLLNP